MSRPATIPHNIIDALSSGAMTYRDASRQTGVSLGALHRRVARLGAPRAPKRLTDLGYRDDIPAKTPAEAWEEHANAFERKLSASVRSQSHEIRRPGYGAYVIYHATDVHLDDDATPLRLLEEDILASRNMGAIVVHGGDALNNWPSGGRLASKYGDQSCTLPDGLLRLQHYVDMMQPHIWVDGNHEEFASHLPFLIERFLPSHTITDYWTCDVTVRSPGGRDLRLAVSHKFQKGSSWFHRLHGHIREMLEVRERDLMLDGHLHSSGVLEHTLPERGHTALCVASAGYKCIDRFAARISHGGKVPRIKGRAHWIVVDPQADPDGTFCAAFTDPMQAQAVLDGLQNLRAA